VRGHDHPAYLPAGGLSNSPFGTLFGRKMIFTENAAAMSAQGDITLCSPSSVDGSKAEGVRPDVGRSIFFAQMVGGAARSSASSRRL